MTNEIERSLPIPRSIRFGLKDWRTVRSDQRVTLVDRPKRIGLRNERGSSHGRSDMAKHGMWNTPDKKRIAIESLPNPSMSDQDFGNCMGGKASLPGLAYLEVRLETAKDLANGNAIASDLDGIVAGQPLLHFLLSRDYSRMLAVAEELTDFR